MNGVRCRSFRYHSASTVTARSILFPSQRRNVGGVSHCVPVHPRSHPSASLCRIPRSSLWGDHKTDLLKTRHSLELRNRLLPRHAIPNSDVEPWARPSAAPQSAPGLRVLGCRGEGTAPLLHRVSESCFTSAKASRTKPCPRARQVSGHEFTRAVTFRKYLGFSP